MNTIKQIIPYILCIGLIYFVFAFGYWGINPNKWDFADRLFCGILITLSIPLLYCLGKIKELD